MRTEPGEGPPLGREGTSYLTPPPGPLDTPTQTLLCLEAGAPASRSESRQVRVGSRKEASVCPAGLLASHGSSH